MNDDELQTMGWEFLKGRGTKVEQCEVGLILFHGRDVVDAFKAGYRARDAEGMTLAQKEAAYSEGYEAGFNKALDLTKHD